jgi:hypothetical protein
MLQQLIDHNEDIRMLKDDGLVLEVRAGFLLIHRIPYVNKEKKIKYGVLVTSLQLVGNKTKAKPEHTVFFAGEMPCDNNGNPLNKILNSSKNQVVAGNFEVHHYFSSKPATGYADYYHKMTTYIRMICNHAKSLDNSVSERGNKIIDSSEDSVFEYLDTNSNKPELSSLSELFKKQKVAIVGMGGTGSYILDLISKTPLQKILIIDGDWYYNNNAFRSPGAASIDELLIPSKKTDLFQRKYAKMHKNIVSYPDYLTEDRFNLLEEMNFVFICIDKGGIKKKMIQYLENCNIPFIDVGMGILNKNGLLTGMVRVTTSNEQQRTHVWEKNRIPFCDDLENDYSTNIQIAELNAINAAFAVIKWKKLLGYYHDTAKEFNTFYRISSNGIINEDNIT